VLEAILATVCFATIPALLVENKGAIGSLRRSAELVRANAFRVLGIVAAIGLLAVIPKKGSYSPVRHWWRASASWVRFIRTR
jgi:hypothetical protein